MHFLTWSHTSSPEQGDLSVPERCAYTVGLQEPADAAKSRCTWKDPTSGAYQAPPGLHCAVLNCIIHKYNHGQETFHPTVGKLFKRKSHIIAL